jgi:hypothetical protein
MLIPGFAAATIPEWAKHTYCIRQIISRGIGNPSPVAHKVCFTLRETAAHWRGVLGS